LVGSGQGFGEETLFSGTRTASGQDAAVVGWGGATSLRAQLDVTAVSGTAPTLNVTVEDTLDGVNWNSILTFAQRVAVGREVFNLTTPFADRLRVRWVMAGTTPSFTWSVIVASKQTLP